LLHQKIETVVYEVTGLAAQEKEGNDKRAQLVEARHAGRRPRTCGAGNAGHVDDRTRTTPAAARHREFRPDRKQSSRSRRKSRCASFPGAQGNRSNNACASSRRSSQQRKQRVQSFLQRKAQFGIGDCGFAEQDFQRLTHEREVVNAHTAELVARKQTQEGHWHARGIVARIAAALDAVAAVARHD
jgi:hypothetical protein